MQKTSKRKRIRIPRTLGISLSFFSLLIFFPSCYEPIEGCLDINSANYDVSADRACDSCCTFPNFNLNLEQVFNGEDFSLGDTLTNNLRTQFTITDYSIIFSDFKLIGDESSYTIADSTKVDCNSTANNHEVNDLIRINNFSRFATIGEWKTSEVIENISFKLGLNDCYHNAGIDGLDANSRINSIDTLYESGIGFRTFFLEINDTLVYEFIGSPETIDISQPLIASNSAGSPLVINMSIDFGIWLSDFTLEDNDQMAKVKLAQNASQAVSFIE